MTVQSTPHPIVRLNLFGKETGVGADPAFALRVEPQERLATSRINRGERAFYVASRASLYSRPAMWRALRREGVNIVSTWIDEAGDGETECFTELWARIFREIAACDRLVLYAETDDFPLKGALIEVGIALGMRKPVTVCLPGVEVQGRTHRPVGSWIEHEAVTRDDDIRSALGLGAA